jgi:hypothetical protein
MGQQDRRASAKPHTIKDTLALLGTGLALTVGFIALALYLSRSGSSDADIKGILWALIITAIVAWGLIKRRRYKLWFEKLPDVEKRRILRDQAKIEKWEAKQRTKGKII